MLKIGGKLDLTNGPISCLGDSVFVMARFLSRSVTEIFDEALRPFGISAAQFVLLSMIGETGSITRAEMARLRHLERSTLTRNLRLILSDGLVEEVSDNADGRSRPIALTAAGKELLLNAQPAWLRATAQAKARLGREGTMALISIADRITYPAEESSEDPCPQSVNATG